jgi:DNA polymerase III epsilon subunit-like protein
MKKLEGVHGWNVGSFVHTNKLHDLARVRLFDNDQSLTNEQMEEELYDLSSEEGWEDLLGTPIDGVLYERTYPCPTNGDDYSYISELVLPSEEVIDEVLEQIQKDIRDGDLTAIAELLTFVPVEYLKGFLPEKL